MAGAFSQRGSRIVAVAPHAGDDAVDHVKMWHTMLTWVPSLSTIVDSCSTYTSSPARCTVTFSVVSDVAC